MTKVTTSGERVNTWMWVAKHAMHFQVDSEDSDLCVQMRRLISHSWAHMQS